MKRGERYPEQLLPGSGRDVVRADYGGHGPAIGVPSENALSSASTALSVCLVPKQVRCLAALLPVGRQVTAGGQSSVTVVGAQRRWCPQRKHAVLRLAVAGVDSAATAAATMYPPWDSTAREQVVVVPSARLHRARVLLPHSRVEPSRSVNNKVTVPVGSSGIVVLGLADEPVQFGERVGRSRLPATTRRHAPRPRSNASSPSVTRDDSSACSRSTRSRRGTLSIRSIGPVAKPTSTAACSGCPASASTSALRDSAVTRMIMSTLSLAVRDRLAKIHQRSHVITLQSAELGPQSEHEAEHDATRSGAGERDALLDRSKRRVPIGLHRGEARDEQCAREHRRVPCSRARCTAMPACSAAPATSPASAGEACRLSKKARAKTLARFGRAPRGHRGPFAELRRRGGHERVRR